MCGHLRRLLCGHSAILASTCSKAPTTLGEHVLWSHHTLCSFLVHSSGFCGTCCVDIAQREMKNVHQLSIPVRMLKFPTDSSESANAVTDVHHACIWSEPLSDNDPRTLLPEGRVVLAADRVPKTASSLDVRPVSHFGRQSHSHRSCNDTEMVVMRTVTCVQPAFLLDTTRHTQSSSAQAVQLSNRSNTNDLTTTEPCGPRVLPNWKLQSCQRQKRA